jgi:plasmid stabilization system protein ParE
MKVVYTAAAIKDLGEIADWLAIHYPAIAPAVELRIERSIRT